MKEITFVLTCVEYPWVSISDRAEFIEIIENVVEILDSHHIGVHVDNFIIMGHVPELELRVTARLVLFLEGNEMKWNEMK